MLDVSQEAADSTVAGWSPAVAVVTFAAYAIACAPTAYLLDSAELAQAGFGLGVAHPPGEPLAALWTKLWCLLPVGGVAFRAGLAQAAAGAIAAVLAMRLALRLFALVDVTDALEVRTRTLLAAAAALGFAFAPGVVAVSVRPEVYALETALSLGALLCGLRAGADHDARFLLLAALLIGLGLAVHPLVAGLTGIGATAAALPFLRRPGRARLVGWSVLALALGALPLIYLPVRACTLFQHAAQGRLDGADTVVWGDARSASGLAWLLSAHTFATKASVVHTAARPYDLPFVLMEELEVVFALLAPVGLFFLLRRPKARLAAAVLGLGWAGSAGAAVFAGLDPANPDVRGYLGPAIALTALFSACALVAGLVPMGAARRWLTSVLAALVLVGTATRFPAGSTYPGLRHATAADRMTGDLLGELPLRAALLTAHYESAFLVGYQRLVEGRRPDVAWAHLGFVRGPGYARRISDAQPALASLVAAHQIGTLTDAALGTVDARRPVRLEPDEHLGPMILGHLLPAGLTWKRGDQGTGYDLHAPSAPVISQATDPQVLGFLAWRAYSDAGLACRNELAEPAAVNLALLHRLLPVDERAKQLAAQCAALVEPRRFLPKSR